MVAILLPSIWDKNDSFRLLISNIVIYFFYWLRQFWGRIRQLLGLRRGSTAARWTGFVGSNPAGRMNVFLFWVLCVVRFLCIGLIIHPEESYRLYCVWLWSWNPSNEETKAHDGWRTMEKKLNLLVGCIFWYLKSFSSATCTMVSGSFLGVKRPGRGINHPSPSSAVVKERRNVSLYSHCVQSWHVVSWNFHIFQAHSYILIR
jgi:hypothetical protein